MTQYVQQEEVFIVEPPQIELPPEAPLNAVCTEFVYLGYREETDLKTQLKKWVKKGLFVFQTEARDSRGKRFQLYREFNCSVWETSALHGILSTWVEGYAGGAYNLRLLPGRPALLLIKYQNAKNDGHTYAKVVSISRLMPGMRPIQPEDYVRPEWLATKVLNRVDTLPSITAPLPPPTARQILAIPVPQPKPAAAIAAPPRQPEPARTTAAAAPQSQPVAPVQQPEACTSQNLDDLMAAPVGKAEVPSVPDHSEDHDEGVDESDVPF